MGYSNAKNTVLLIERQKGELMLKNYKLDFRLFNNDGEKLIYKDYIEKMYKWKCTEVRALMNTITERFEYEDGTIKFSEIKELEKLLSERSDLAIEVDKLRDYFEDENKEDDETISN